jgi:hypothetical protein
VRASLWSRERKSKSSIAISVAIHVVMLAALATITFHYPLSDFFRQPDRMQSVPVRFIPLEPHAAASSGAQAAKKTRAQQPTPLPSVSSIPVGVPAPAAPVAASTRALGAGGSATAQAGADPAVGIGIRPGIPDGRLITNPLLVPGQPQTEAQQAEKIIASIYQEYLDSARAAMNNPGRDPGDWSWGGKDGDKWGWDKNGVHIGGITIPNIVLAALPIPVTGATDPVNMRSRQFITSDIRAHAGLMTEDEFRAAVRRVRERVDRERRERMEKEAGKRKDPPCCG